MEGNTVYKRLIVQKIPKNQKQKNRKNSLSFRFKYLETRLSLGFSG